jgi:hypothetical protein
MNKAEIIKFRARRLVARVLTVTVKCTRGEHSVNVVVPAMNEAAAKVTATAAAERLFALGLDSGTFELQPDGDLQPIFRRRNDQSAN